MHERLLLVAHGTASDAGAATITELRSAVAATRPDLDVDLCYLDVLAPRLGDVLDDRPTVVVPALLSTGYHVQSDIPAALAAHPRSRPARHLGPHPLLIDALIARLPDRPGARTVLAAAGSSRAEAATEVTATAHELGERLGHPVETVTVGRDLGDRIATLDGPLRIATYLLAEGSFLDMLRAAVGDRGPVAAPLGAHPSVVELIWRRYDAVAVTR